MKMQALLSAVCLLLLLNGARMGSARHIRHAPQALFAFGDSFVDSGNLPRPDHSSDEMFRQWFNPYGISSDEREPTGRFSDFLVQSDFVARMLGLPLSPPTYQSTHSRDHCSPDGMNYAFGSTGVFPLSIWIDLREQIDVFKNMVKKGIISQDQVAGSVALIAISGNDYKHFGVHVHDNTEFIGNVTSEIAVNVERLLELGVKKILVNNLHPLGCTPALSRARNYKACSEASNDDASEHNVNLVQKLGNKKEVFIVDMHSAFHNIIGNNGQGADSESSSYNQFKENQKPCCEAVHPNGFCGQHDDNSEPLYSLCADPTNHFFWDDAHPTHAAWQAVMKQLQDPIKHFPGLV